MSGQVLARSLYFSSAVAVLATGKSQVQLGDPAPAGETLASPPWRHAGRGTDRVRTGRVAYPLDGCGIHEMGSGLTDAALVHQGTLLGLGGAAPGPFSSTAIATAA